MSNVNWGVLLTTSFLCLLAASCFYFSDTSSDTIVKCYDRYNNEIVGQVCKDTPNFSDFEKNVGAGTFMLGGLLPILVGITLELKERRYK